MRRGVRTEQNRLAFSFSFSSIPALSQSKRLLLKFPRVATKMCVWEGTPGRTVLGVAIPYLPFVRWGRLEG